MEHVAKHVTDLVGHTPLLELTRWQEVHGIKGRILAKLEYLNPLGSVKDRVAVAMIEEGIKAGKINEDTVIIEPTSGNTGIGLAMAAAVKGLRLILTMPDTMSLERQKIVNALGAEVVLTPGIEGMRGSIGKAEELRQSYGNASFLSSLTIRPIRPFTGRRRPKKSGTIRTARSISSFRPSGQAAPLPARLRGYKAITGMCRSSPSSPKTRLSFAAESLGPTPFRGLAPVSFPASSICHS